MQKLIQYLRDQNLTQTQFADRIGITQAALSRMLSGRIAPSLKTAVEIEAETSGAVPVASWIAEASTTEFPHPKEDAA